MDFELSAAQQVWSREARSIGRELPSEPGAPDVIQRLARAGLIEATRDLLSAALIVEALGEEAPSAAVVVALHASAMPHLIEHGKFEGVGRGELVAATMLSTEEVPVVDTDEVSGRSSWVGPLTSGGVAVVAGRQGEAVVACATSLASPRVATSVVDTAALRGVVFGHLTFDRVPAATLGEPFPIMARVRTLFAAAGLGMGRRALREALAAARVYSRMGAGGEQTVQGLLADAATELDASMLLVWKAAAAPVLSLAEASMAKLAVTDAAQRAVTRATQVVGVETFRSGHVVERLAQDVRALELFAGRTEALREAVALEILPQVR